MAAFAGSAASGLALHLWLRNRVGLCLAGAYTVALTLLARLPVGTVSSVTIFALCIPCGFSILYLIGAFSHADADVTSAESAYPGFLLRLPVATWALVFWPMCFGVCAVSLAWLTVALLIVGQRGVELPAVWPAAMLSAIVASAQAILWTPLRYKFMRLALVILVVPALLGLTLGAAEMGADARLLTAWLVGTVACAYLWALIGVTRARSGAPPPRAWSIAAHAARTGDRFAQPKDPSGPPDSWRQSSRLRVRTIDAGLSPHAHTRAAMLWLEWRRRGCVVPLITAGLCALLSLPLAWSRELTPVVVPPGLLGSSAIEVNAFVRAYLPLLLAVPLIVATLMGAGPDAALISRTPGLSVFLSTRPVSDAAIAAIRWLAAIRTTAWSCAVALLFAAAWLLLPARSGALAQPLALLVLRRATPALALLSITSLLILVGWTWRGLVIGQFAALSPHRWLLRGYPAAINLLMLAALVLGLNWSAQPEAAPSAAAIVRLSLLAVCLAAVLKAIAGLCVARLLLQHRLVSSALLRLALVIWLAAVTALWGLLCAARPQCAIAGWTLPSELTDPRVLYLLSLLAIPFVRLGGSILSASSSRHG